MIEEVIATGANDVWVVRDGDLEVLVPVIENVVKSIDLGARRMVIVTYDFNCLDYATPILRERLEKEMGISAGVSDPARHAQSRNQTEYPGNAISNRNHSPFAWRTGVIGNWPGSLKGYSATCVPLESISCRKYPC